MRRVKVAVPIDVARERALCYLDACGVHALTKANNVGYAIWPGVSMTSQGAGGAANRILRGLQKDGLLVEWKVASGRSDWGWRITPAGKRWLKGRRVGMGIIR